jgi:hypothetical protein
MKTPNQALQPTAGRCATSKGKIMKNEVKAMFAPTSGGSACSH